MPEEWSVRRGWSAQMEVPKYFGQYFGGYYVMDTKVSIWTDIQYCIKTTFTFHMFTAVGELAPQRQDNITDAFSNK